LASTALGAARLPAFSDSRNLRLFLGTLLYLAQGFPQGVVFYAIPSWLAVNGQSAAVVGMAATAATLPWMVKWAVGGLMDRYTYLPMGRRRPWLAGSQICIAFAFLAYAVLSPSPDNVTLVIAMTFLISSFTTIQDVALDALVIDLTPDGEKGRMNGFMFAGKLFGIAGGLAITAYFIEFYGISVAMLAMLVLFSIPAIAVIVIRERPGEKLLPWSNGQASAEARAIKPEAWLPIFRIALRTLLRRDTLLVIALLIAYGFHQTLYEQGSALFAARQLGWGESAYGNLAATSNLILGGLSLLIGGWLVDRFGPRATALIGGFFGAALLIGYAYSEQLWASDNIFVAWFLIGSAGTTLFYLSFLVLAMRVSAKEVAATSFALIVATHALGSSTSGALLGPIEEIGGFTAIFAISGLVIALAALTTFGMRRETAGPLGKEHELEAVLTTD